MRLCKYGRTEPKAKECVELMLKYNREAGVVDASCPEDVDAILAAPKRKSREPNDEDDASPLKEKFAVVLSSPADPQGGSKLADLLAPAHLAIMWSRFVQVCYARTLNASTASM